MSNVPTVTGTPGSQRNAMVPSRQSAPVVPLEPQYQIVSAPNPDPNQFALDLWASFDVTSIQGKALILKAMNGTTHRVAEAVNKTIPVQDAVCHPVELTDPETGEVTQEIRCVLIEPDGTMHACVSRGVFKSLGLISKLFGKLPWVPAIPLVITQVKTRMGRTTLVASVEPPETHPVNPAKKKG